MTELPALAYVNGRLATGLLDLTSDPAALDSTGFWVVVQTYEGELTAARFESVREVDLAEVRSRWPWRGPHRQDWESSIDEGTYVAAVEKIRDYIAAGEVYQANLCRIMSAPVPDPAAIDVVGLAHRLAVGNPAPYSAVVRLPAADLHVASASPELYLSRRGCEVTSRPIKGTGRTAADLLPKDHAENVMIVDLVRNDLGRVCEIGSIAVPELCVLEEHPGLVHLVSTVTGRLLLRAGWPELLAATFPPGSVTGAPKSSALRIIDELEPVGRGPYCGAIGWVDADRGLGELAVGIRTFWAAGGMLHFGTGAGITWGSDPDREWAETELKAARLVALASAG
ncbi:MAG: chorismate-binding protein [Sporichthyaceae bacterium]|nr:chorismate-binding protein [Sporichthyaceae bacterium]